MKELCSEASRSLRETGALLVKDPRCTAKDNHRFFDMMERYIDSTLEFKRLQEKPNCITRWGSELFVSQENVAIK